MRLLKFTFVLVVLLSACATATGWQAYNLAQESVDTLQDQYIAAFKEADEQTQNVWRLKYPPMFMDVNEALDAWEFVLLLEEPTTDAEIDFNRVKQKLLNAILEIEHE